MKRKNNRDQGCHFDDSHAMNRAMLPPNPFTYLSSLQRRYLFALTLTPQFG
jgi:hypothetical protein